MKKYYVKNLALITLMIFCSNLKCSLAHLSITEESLNQVLKTKTIPCYLLSSVNKGLREFLLPSLFRYKRPTFSPSSLPIEEASIELVKAVIGTTYYGFTTFTLLVPPMSPNFPNLVLLSLSIWQTTLSVADIISNSRQIIKINN